MKFSTLRVLAVLLVTVPALPGCSLYQAYAQRAAIRQAQFHLKSVSIDSVNFAGASVTVTLDLDNPTDTELQLDRIDYTLYVNELRAFAGSTGTSVHVPVHQSADLPIHATVRFSDMGAEVRSLLLTGRHFKYRLSGVGHFDTPFGPIDYPIEVAPAAAS